MTVWEVIFGPVCILNRAFFYTLFQGCDDEDFLTYFSPISSLVICTENAADP